jgi:acyl carrier protein
VDSLSFDRFAEFVRRWAFVPSKKEIQTETQFERDLGITGDDGSDLLVATEKEFGVSLSSEESGYRETFGLGQNEYLFNSEGGTVWEPTTLFGTSTVRAFTVGELYLAVKRALELRNRAQIPM